MGLHVVVTGCAGLIGFHVARMLVELGHSVQGIDSLTDSYSVQLKQWRLDNLLKCAQFTFHRPDITDEDSLRATFEALHSSQHPDAVINLAGWANVRDSVNNPRPYYEANVLGTLNLLEMCREFGIGRFILASTSSVYGLQPSGPIAEDAESDRPLSPYGASKLAAEALLHSYHHLHGINVTVLRYFTVYGPAGRPDMSVLGFIRAVSEGEPITLFGDGTQRRDFTYVDDVARGTVASLRLNGYEVINLGTDQAIMLKDVIQLIEDSVGRSAQVQYKARDPADPLETRANIDRARMLLGWSPEVGIQDGIRNTVAWYTENREWARHLR